MITNYQLQILSRSVVLGDGGGVGKMELLPEHVVEGTVRDQIVEWNVDEAKMVANDRRSVHAAWPVGC